MKRKILSLVFAAAMLLGYVTPVDGGTGEPCGTYVMTCGPGGPYHYVIICDQGDAEVWFEELCQR